MVMCITGLWLREVLLIFCGLVRGFAGAYGVLRERSLVMVNGWKSLFFGDTLYIYNVCLVYRRQVYEEFTEKDGLWHRVKFGFIAEKTIKEGVEVVQCSSYNTI